VQADLEKAFQHYPELFPVSIVVSHTLEGSPFRCDLLEYNYLLTYSQENFLLSRIIIPTIETSTVLDSNRRSTMTDFLSREADILGDEFSTPVHGTTSGDDIDFDRAASAFPDIDLDSGSFISSSQPPTVAARTSNGFSFDDFGSPLPSQKKDTQVKVTGDDDFDTFESEFPEIDAGQVSRPVSNRSLLYWGFFKHKMQLY
jgi:hypothetical protein